MMSDESERMTSDDGAESVRRERVVDRVMTRIAAAPPISRPMVAVTMASWTGPVLVAAAAVMIVATAALMRTASDRADPVAEALGVPAPVARYLATGQSDIRDWLPLSGSGR
jgi:hypothetical protein